MAEPRHNIDEGLLGRLTLGVSARRVCSGVALTHVEISTYFVEKQKSLEVVSGPCSSVEF